LLTAFLLIAAVPLNASADETQNIPTNAAGTGNHDSLVAALTHGGLVSTLEGDGPFTVFAPTDAAFAEAGIDLSSFDTDEENATLVDILTYHVLDGAVDAANVTDGLVATMLNGDNATFTVDNGSVMIENANVTTADVLSSNGIIHVIDKVLMPPADEPAPQGPPGVICYNVVTHTIVVGADEATCDAYMYLEDYEMNGQNVTGCYNGVTHALANVSQAVCEGYMWVPAVNLAMTAAATTVHTSLVTALTAADLVATVSGTDNYTVFAPTDEAFVAAGIDLDSYDTEEEIAALADILLYHVVAGTVASTDIAAGTSTVAAANGDNLTIVAGESGVTINGANVTIVDVPASNGVIHVIDQVLMPPVDEPTVTDPFDGVTCAATIGIGPSGYAFSPSLVNIDVGETVCWSWEDASMPHNVKEVNGYQSTTYVENGITSGDAMTTVAFHHTFTEATTFYYACEPHIGLDMFGEVVVGDGGEDVNQAVDDAEESEDTPGFVATTAFLAMVGAVLMAGRRFETDE
jgi:transforming growth factor-beta-induced protein